MQVLIVEEHYPLKALNTFGIEAKARWFITVNNIVALQEIVKFSTQELFILGGGSNMLLTSDLERLVVKNDIKGISVVAEDTKTVLVEVGGGEVWHDFVLWAIAHNYGGVENLSLIPGTVGAAPIQNIGAYGVELESVFERLEAVDLETGQVHAFVKEACQFGYRDSVFKHKFKGDYAIAKVYFRLSKAPYHELNTSYGAIQVILEYENIDEPTVKDVSDAVIRIRSSKLPDPKELGNSGSFFKNPIITKEQFDRVQHDFPDLVFYPLVDGRIKVPAAWLIEQCGWKGKRVGNTGCYSKQALVLVNYGGATGQEIETLAYKIIASVREKFGITLFPEVNIF